MKKIMILSVLIMIPNWAVAGNSNIPHTHTNTPIELEFVSPDSSGIRVAVVCFLGMGDCGSGGLDDMSIDSAQRCINEGYDKISCVLPAYLSDVCPYNEGYFAQCVMNQDCASLGYTKTAAECPPSPKACAQGLQFVSYIDKCGNKCNICSAFSIESMAVGCQDRLTCPLFPTVVSGEVYALIRRRCLLGNDIMHQMLTEHSYTSSCQCDERDRFCAVGVCSEPMDDRFIASCLLTGRFY